MNNLTGKVALVTGASKGIGKASAKRLAALGAHVVLAARSASLIEANAAEINAKGGSASWVECDVAVFSDVKNAIYKTNMHFGGFDILVNNAGVIEPISLLADSDPDVWSLAVDINLKGVYYGMRAAIPLMREMGGGTIINISSGAANSALEGWSHYCSTKAAAKKLTEIAHKEVTEDGIRIIGLSPGTVATEMMSKIRNSGINPVSQLDPATHIPPEWPGEAVAFLCGPGGDDFCGTDFSIKTEEGRRLVGLDL